MKNSKTGNASIPPKTTAERYRKHLLRLFWAFGLLTLLAAAVAIYLGLTSDRDTGVFGASVICGFSLGRCHIYAEEHDELVERIGRGGI